MMELLSHPSFAHSGPKWNLRVASRKVKKRFLLSSGRVRISRKSLSYLTYLRRNVERATSPHVYSHAHEIRVKEKKD